MSLPIVNLNQDERWDCHQCGYCCRGTLISLSPDDVERLKAQRWEEQAEYRHARILVRGRGLPSSVRLAHRSDGSCIFLAEDGLCKIHSKFGAEAKPTVCQTFPLQLVPHDKQVVLTLRRACPSAAADLGSAIAKQLPFVKQLVHDKRLQAEAIPPPMLKAGEVRDWKTVRVVLESAANLLQDPRYPPVRRLVHALQFASLLNSAKTKPLSDSQIVELARTLAELAPEESQPFFSERQPPKSYSKILFRLLAIDCARLHPDCRHKSKWSARYELMRTAVKVVRGSGTTPHIDQVFPTASLSQLDLPSGVLRPDIYRPLTRFIETTAGSFMYAIADRRGWSVVDSIRALALLFPVGLWLLKWLAHGREPNVQDMVKIVVALDRSQGYEPLSGSLHRWRLATLGANAELERLVAWYAR